MFEGINEMPDKLFRVAIIDDTQNIAAEAAEWNKLDGRAELMFFHEPFADEADAAKRLRSFDIVVPMRERTAFTSSLLEHLPGLKLIALTGRRAPSLDLQACTRLGILVCNSSGDTDAATAELAFALIMACARNVPLADRAMRSGGWQESVPIGTVLEGKRLGIVGLGRLGTRVAGYGKAFGMEVGAWSQNLTKERAEAAGVRFVEKLELFKMSDVISIHLVLSDRTRGIVGAAELAAMKKGAILVNTSRGPIVSESALLESLAAGRIRAGLDVFEREPLPADHPLRRFANVVTTPHFGYCAPHVFRQYYGESLENILAWLDGAPIRIMNPDALAHGRDTGNIG